MTVIDTHTHLYGEKFDADRDSVMQRAVNIGVEKFYLPGIDSDSIEQIFKAEKDYPGRCIAMMGLHPCSVKENYKQELQVVAGWLAKRSFAAVGEIGLDFYWDVSFADQQYEAFRFQIELALQYRLPIVIHTRNAMPQTIAVVQAFAGKGLHGIFHCFGGSYHEAKQVIDAGFMLGIGGVVTYKNSGLPEVLASIPIEHIVLETDAPYLAPVPYRGKRNESSYLLYVIEKLADIYKVSTEEIAAQTTANAQQVFAY